MGTELVTASSRKIILTSAEEGAAEYCRADFDII